MIMRIIIVLIFLSIISCEKEKNGENQYQTLLKGYWINTTTDYDELIFVDDSTIERKNLKTDKTEHIYRYEIKGDSITFDYEGYFKVLLPSFTTKLNFNRTKDTLTLDNFDQYFPPDYGNSFYKIKNY